MMCALAVGCWLLAVGCWLVAGGWWLVAGGWWRWLLAAVGFDEIPPRLGGWMEKLVAVYNTIVCNSSWLATWNESTFRFSDIRQDLKNM